MIKRTARRENFTVLGNAIFAENGLSFEAMGLLAYLLSKPDNWAVHVNALVKATEGTAQQRGKNKIHSLLNELIGAGYITRKRQSSGEMAYYVFDESQDVENKPQPSNPAQANPAQANPAQAFEAVLINTEGQQELKEKKERMGSKRAGARETAPAVAGESSPTCPAEAKPESRADGGKAKFDPMAALLALGVDWQSAVDWLAVRKARRAPLTRSALDGVIREANQAGIPVSEAVRIAAERGWQGFNADWDWRSGGTPHGRVFDHATGAVASTGNSAVDLAQQQAARAADWLASLPADEEGNLL